MGRHVNFARGPLRSYFDECRKNRIHTLYLDYFRKNPTYTLHESYNRLACILAASSENKNKKSMVYILYKRKTLAKSSSSNMPNFEKAQPE